MQDVRGKTAFITGGASGIGLAMAQSFAAAGMRVVIADIDAEALAQAEKNLRQEGAAVAAAVLDVTQADAWAAVADRVESDVGPIDVLCNNAGMGQGRTAANRHYRLTEVSRELWALLLDTNLSSVYHGIKTFAPRMVARGQGGHIVNTASMAGLLAPPGLSVYVATKFAVLGLSECVRAELAPHHIGVSVLCPGAVQSNLVATSASRRRARPETTVGMETALAAPAPTDHVSMRARSVGDRVLAAIRSNELYVLTHPEYAPLVEERFSAILGAIGPSAEEGYADTAAMLQRSRSPIFADMPKRAATLPGGTA
ncbi:MAG: SDR family NAD(P)-dependent oxidoreductase [Rhodoferax sp.]